MSNTLMYEFWYNHIKPKYGKNAKLCFTDMMVLLIILKLKIFTKILLMMLKKDLTHQVVKSIGHCLLEKTRKLLD